MRNSSNAEVRPSLWNSVAAKWLGDGPMLGFGIHDSIIDKTTRWWMIPVASNGINDNLVGCFNFQCLFSPVFWDVWLTSICLDGETYRQPVMIILVDTCKECSCTAATLGDTNQPAAISRTKLFQGIRFGWTGLKGFFLAYPLQKLWDAKITMVNSGELLII